MNRWRNLIHKLNYSWPAILTYDVSFVVELHIEILLEINERRLYGQFKIVRLSMLSHKVEQMWNFFSWSSKAR